MWYHILVKGNALNNRTCTSLAFSEYYEYSADTRDCQLLLIDLLAPRLGTFLTMLFSTCFIVRGEDTGIVRSGQ
jgi:hypothetical protein